ncbi:DNA polymerase [Aphelenchoides bicaudatus]|nr:DNA polymerase [Aphelenchoides bicaudatus]
MADNNNTGRRQSSRRVVSSAQQQRKSALEELKNARKSGKIYRRNTDNLVKDLYETVTEEEYNEIQRQRADKNFVEDDDGTGYYDDGTFDDFDEEEEDQYAQSSSSKDNHKARQEEMKKKKGGIFKFLNVNVKPKETASENEPCNLEEDPDMLSMLEQLDQSYAAGNETENPAFSFGLNNFGEPLNSQPIEPFQLGSTLSWPAENPFNDPIIEPVIEEQISTPQVSVPIEKSAKRTMPISPSEVSAPKVLKLDKEEEPKQTPLMSDQQFDQFDQFEEAEEEDQKETDEQPENSDVLRMYWIETFEDVYKDPGSVYLFGKVNGQSCCVLVRNIEHKVYFLPRKLDGDSDQNLTEVRNEVAAMFKNDSFFKTSGTKDKDFKSAFETIKWIPTEENIPRELRALMVLYKGHLPNIPAKTSGNTFSHVLNSTTTAMERLLLGSQIAWALLD